MMNLFTSHEFNSLRDLLLGQLRDLYDAEKRLTDALPKLADTAHAPELRQTLRDHLDQTYGHVTRLEDVFHRLSVEPERATCAAMKGLIHEGETIARASGAPAVLDAGIIAAAQRVEHYEMAGYGSARTFAEQLGHRDVASILQATLDEESKANERLNEIAMQAVNLEAARAS